MPQHKSIFQCHISTWNKSQGAAFVIIFSWVLSEAISIYPFFRNAGVECRSAEISAVNLEGFPSFWSWKCFNVIVLLCLCMIFSAELREKTKQLLKWVRIKWGAGKHYHGVVSSFMCGSWISSCLLCELILFEESICLY